MITQSIVAYQPKMREGKDGKPRFITGSEEHRRHILARTCAMIESDTTFVMGEMYKIHGRSRGQLLFIQEDYKSVKWEGLKPLCIEMYLPSEDEIELFHPSDLEKA